MLLAPPSVVANVLQPPLNILVTVLTDPSLGADEVLAATTENPTVALTPLGVLVTLLTWASLLGINAWCFRRILRQSQESR